MLEQTSSLIRPSLFLSALQVVTRHAGYLLLIYFETRLGTWCKPLGRCWEGSSTALGSVLWDLGSIPRMSLPFSEKLLLQVSSVLSQFLAHKSLHFILWPLTSDDQSGPQPPHL